MAQLNIQIPDELKQKFTELVQARGLTQQSVILEFIRQWCNSEPPAESQEVTLDQLDRKLDSVINMIRTGQVKPKINNYSFSPGDRIRVLKAPPGKRSSKIINQKGTVINCLNGKFVVNLDSGSSCELTGDYMELLP